MSNTEYMRKYFHTETGRAAVYRARNKSRDKKRQFILDFFGGKCVHCGFDDARALQMDHINGRNGVAKLGNIDNRYKFVRDNPEEARKIYQMLCANCNFIKREVRQEHYFHGK